MKYRLLIFVTFLQLTARAQQLSPNVQASVVTVEPGEELYSSFGHTGLRIYDPAQGIDRVYSYGTFDFRTDNFYVKFLQGTLPYLISVADMYRTVYAYQYENRTIKEQVLNLSQGQKQRLFDALELNLRPENREYRYKFFYDNCATRPRDRLAQACGDSLRWVTAVDTTKSYRDWMNDYLGRHPWSRMGMNLGIGYPSDVRTSAWEAMYLPNNVYAEIAKARIRTPDGRTMPLTASSSTVFQALPTAGPNAVLAFLTSPNVVLGLLFAVVLLVTQRHRRNGVRGFGLDRALFAFTGVWGWLLLLLWVATDHGVTAWNAAILFMNPMHLPLIFWVTRQKNPAVIRNYFLITAVLILIFFGYSIVFHYVYGFTFYLLTLLLRSAHHVRFNPIAVGRSAHATT
ncbi:Lnb N-terminal periplasmic domain-containing protein [Larkinella soli]|uniref:Lnb N-terminal periplasmic domain-containing protein n=1 Tax=Larkinella soli TaxID=1770527 RepID=UPI000FFCBCE3|nr:DUF4105 domain-containing protein [Larkinella soli]